MSYDRRVTPAALLIDALPEHRRADARALPNLSETLERQLGEIADAWPRLYVDADRYARRLAVAIERRAAEPMQRVIETMPAADLYLAAACLAGDPAALAAFRDALVPSLHQALKAFDVPAATVDETIQRVLVMVLVGETAQIAGFTGRGRLRSWLRSIGVRTGRRLTGALHGPEADADELDALPAAVGGPELDVLRARYADTVRAAFSAALGGLSERQRALLRQYHIDGLTIDQLGALYRINRATAARWVAAARLEIVTATRERLISSGGLPANEVDSIIRLVRSQLSISLHQLG
jgi:RNA polymerase sigma-70 factor, ECF subfamily